MPDIIPLLGYVNHGYAVIAVVPGAGRLPGDWYVTAVDTRGEAVTWHAGRSTAGNYFVFDSGHYFIDRTRPELNTEQALTDMCQRAAVYSPEYKLASR